MATPNNPQNLVTAAQESSQRRQILLQYPAEIPEVDYKAAQLFGKNDFGYKLIKQIIAFANGGGGTLVIGFKEDPSKRLQPDPGMTSDIAASYDISKLTAALNENVRGDVPVPVTVFQQEYQGITYPIIEVEPFTSTPFFAKSDRTDKQGKPILKQGALYIRTARSSSEELATPEDWERLLGIAVTQRQNDLLRRFGDLLRQFGLDASTKSVNRDELQKNFVTWLEQGKRRAEELATAGERYLPGYYLFAYQAEQIPEIVGNDQKLLQIALAARRPNTGWPIGLVPYHFRNPQDRYQPTDNGIEVVIGQNSTDHFDYWLLHRNGGFFIYRNLSEDVPGWSRTHPGQALTASTVVWRVAEAIDHCIALNHALGTAGTTRIWFAAEYGGLNGRHLVNDTNEYFPLPTAPATRDRTRFVKEFSFDQLIADANGIVSDITRQILAIFGFFEAPVGLIEKNLKEYRASKVS